MKLWLILLVVGVASSTYTRGGKKQYGDAEMKVEEEDGMDENGMEMHYETTANSEEHHEMEYEMYHNEMMTHPPMEEPMGEPMGEPMEEPVYEEGMDDSYVMPVPEVTYEAGVMYHGKYEDECGADGFYYRDQFSFVVCSNGKAYIQPCAPGSANGDVSEYNAEKSYHQTPFCGHHTSTDYAIPAYQHYYHYYPQYYYHHYAPYYHLQKLPYYHGAYMHKSLYH